MTDGDSMFTGENVFRILVRFGKVLLGYVSIVAALVNMSISMPIQIRNIINFLFHL